MEPLAYVGLVAIVAMFILILLMAEGIIK